jgi:hypothetical protein
MYEWGVRASDDSSRMLHQGIDESLDNSARVCLYEAMQVTMPVYESEEVLRSKLLMAIRNCVSYQLM